ncbi:hypothetical protein F1C58_16090 (plasmid) [Glaciihabitans sp. INWT7]|uniref:DEAD/DEAH box helicase family protein n=1 Tax=Glaciihabitans sp. INWT7 TaxID=2596912 RepID=UPI0016241AA2|nr:DEAD/DEAH box helicase family protein [Glaciihabitans sp. INWT7]QNE48581.1 hypothetical protein F1C58_16090 [Glaciihabitans sp. INWT7]
MSLTAPSSVQTTPANLLELVTLDVDVAAPKYVLRDYQQKALARTLEALATDSLATVLSACGTGKTVTMLALHEATNSTLTGFFCPNLSLLQQTVASWRALGRKFVALIVCSDPSVGKASVDDISEDELRASLPDIEVTQDPARVAEFITFAESGFTDMPHIVFGTYQSSHKIATAQESTKGTFDLIIADEAHYLGTRDRKASAAENKNGEAVRNPKMIRSDRRVFTTATQRTVSSKNGQDTESHASMDNPALFGTVAFELSLRDAINLPRQANGMPVLTEYEILILAVTETEIEELYPDHQFALDSTDEGARHAMALIAARKLNEEYGVTRMISYHSGVERAQQFAADLLENGFDRARSITADVPMDERREILRQLEDGCVVTNVNCLTEGIDVPALEAVLLVDPRTSEIDIVQIIGRAIRPFRFPDGRMKEKGYVVMPVLAGPDGQPKEGAFENVFNVLRKMAANDERLAQEIIDAGIRAKTGEGDEPEERIVKVDLGGLAGEFHGLALAALTKGLSLQVFEAVTDSWALFLVDLKIWGDAHPGERPTAHSADLLEKRLGKRLIKLRIDNKKGLLPARTKAELTAAMSVWDVVIDATEESLVRFISWCTANPGHKPRSTAVEPEEKFAYKWLKTRRSINKGTINGTKLTSNQLARLNTAFPDWHLVVDATEEGLVRFISWCTANPGHKPRSTAVEPEEKFAYKWLKTRRSINKGTINGTKLTSNQLARLNTAFPDWHLVVDATEEGLVRVIAWCTANPGHKPRSTAVEPEEKFAYKWLKTRRSINKGTINGTKLTSNQLARLNTAFPDWHLVVDATEEGLVRFISWCTANPGHKPRSTAVEPEEKFAYKWLKTRRSINKGTINGTKLTSNQLARLNTAVPGWRHTSR